MGKTCTRFVVTGRVQGVFYRSETKKQAQKLGLTGVVKNLSTGQVEVLACGEQEQIDILHRWLWEGPKASSVSQVIDENVSSQEFSDFIISY